MPRASSGWWPLALFVASTTACLPRERLNSRCEWHGDSAFVAGTRDAAHREHLTLDVRLAEELGIRHGDSFKKVVPIAEARARGQWCTDSSLALIRNLHGVGASQISAVTGTRELWIDVTTIFIPMALVLAFASDRVARRVAGAFEPEERWPRLLALIALAPIVAGFGAVAAHLWSWGVDSIRLGDSHLSYRAIRLPIGRHALESWAVGLFIFAAVVAYRWRSLARLARRVPNGGPLRAHARARVS